jgi:hypothetical protein
MKNIDKRGTFEKAWAEAFTGVEKTPPDAVWDRLEARLARAESNYYKRRVLFFKWMAAASLTFALALGIHQLWLLDSGKPVAERNPVPAAPLQQETIAPVPENKAGIPQTGPDARLPRREPRSEVSGEPDRKLAGRTLPRQPDAHTEIVVVKDASRADDLNALAAGDLPADQAGHPTIAGEPALAGGLSFLPAYGVSQAGPVPEHIYKVPAMPVSHKKSRAEFESQLFAGLNVSAGSFNPNFSGSPAAPGFSSELLAVSGGNYSVDRALNVKQYGSSTSEKYEADLITAYGVDFGWRLAPRWIIQTGLAYSAANSRASTSAYYQPMGEGKRYAILSANSVVADGLNELNFNQSIELDNSYTFASVPLQAGFIVFEDKLSLTLLAGMSSDVFLGNRISDPDNFLTTVQTSPGDNSPYRSVFFSGLLGTSLGYTVADHYRIRIEPGFRVGLNSFTKDSFVLDSRPSAFMMAFGFSYLFD